MPPLSTDLHAIEMEEHKQLPPHKQQLKAWTQKIEQCTISESERKFILSKPNKLTIAYLAKIDQERAAILDEANDMAVEYLSKGDAAIAFGYRVWATNKETGDNLVKALDAHAHQLEAIFDKAIEKGDAVTAFNCVNWNFRMRADLSSEAVDQCNKNIQPVIACAKLHDDHRTLLDCNNWINSYVSINNNKARYALADKLDVPMEISLKQNNYDAFLGYGNRRFSRSEPGSEQQWTCVKTLSNAIETAFKMNHDDQVEKLISREGTWLFDQAVKDNEKEITLPSSKKSALEIEVEKKCPYDFFGLKNVRAPAKSNGHSHAPKND